MIKILHILSTYLGIMKSMTTLNKHNIDVWIKFKNSRRLSIVNKDKLKDKFMKSISKKKITWLNCYKIGKKSNKNISLNQEKINLKMQIIY